MTKEHEKKFENFIKACRLPTTSEMCISELWVIGDTPEEVEMNINYAIDHGKEIYVAKSDYVIMRLLGSSGKPLETINTKP